MISVAAVGRILAAAAGSSPVVEDPADSSLAVEDLAGNSPVGHRTAVDQSHQILCHHRMVVDHLEQSTAGMVVDRMERRSPGYCSVYDVSLLLQCHGKSQRGMIELIHWEPIVLYFVLTL